MRPPERAMVLAAGLGRRLRPLTACFAKPALPLLGTGLVEYSLRRVLRAGIKDVVVNLHHLAKSLEPVLERCPSELMVRRSHENELLGTAGGVKLAEAHLRDGTFLLLNGDTVFDFDLERMLEVHARTGAKATLVVRNKTGGTRFSTVRLDEGGRITGVDTKDQGPGLMFAGVWLLEPSVFALLSGAPAGLEVELLPRLIEEGTAFASVQDGPFVTIDTPSRYWTASLNMAREGLFEEDWSVRRATTHLLCGEGAKIADSAELDGLVVLGKSCRIGKGARLRNVIAWDDVRVPAGADLQDVIVTRGVRLPPRANFSGKLVMNALDDCSKLRRREVRDGLVVAHLDTERRRGLAEIR